MATQYSRTYTYSGGDSYYYHEVNIPISSFTITSGDTVHKITKVISITAQTYVNRHNSSSSTIGWSANLVFSGGTVIGSSEGQKSCSVGSWKQFTSEFSASISTINSYKWSSLQSIVSVADGGAAYVKHNNSNRQLNVTVIFESEEYLPSITGFDGSRYDAEHSRVDDNGEAFAYGFALAVEKTTTQTDEPTYIRLMTGNTVLRTFYDTQTGSSMATINAWISGQKTDVITDYQFSIGANYLLRLEFCYHGELVTTEWFISKAFVNMHESGATDLNGAQIGGVAIGQYSSVTRQEGIPKFECNYPAFFYKGIYGLNVYGESEIDTGGKWIGGSPIFRQIITFNAIVGTNQTAKKADGISDIEISGIDTMVRMEGFAKWPGTKVFVPLNYYAGSGQYTAIWLASDPSKIYYSSSSACEIVAIIYYTKTS